MPIIIAKQLGYFRDEGLDVTIAAFSGGSKALEAMLGGSTDMTAGAYSNTLTMAAKGQKLVTIAAQVVCPGWVFGVSRKNFDKVKSPADLKGMRVGVSAPGSSTHMVVNYILHKAGLKADDVSIIGVGQAAGAVAAVRAGQIDALIVNDPVATMLVDGGDLMPLAEMRTADGNKQVFGADYPESSVYATKSFVDKNPTYGTGCRRCHRPSRTLAGQGDPAAGRDHGACRIPGGQQGSVRKSLREQPPLPVADRTGVGRWRAYRP